MPVTHRRQPSSAGNLVALAGLMAGRPGGTERRPVSPLVRTGVGQPLGQMEPKARNAVGVLVQTPWAGTTGAGRRLLTVIAFSRATLIVQFPRRRGTVAQPDERGVHKSLHDLHWFWRCLCPPKGQTVRIERLGLRRGGSDHRHSPVSSTDSAPPMPCPFFKRPSEGEQRCDASAADGAVIHKLVPRGGGQERSKYSACGAFEIERAPCRLGRAPSPCLTRSTNKGCPAQALQGFETRLLTRQLLRIHARPDA